MSSLQAFAFGWIGQDWGYQVDLAFGSMGIGIPGIYCIVLLNESSLMCKCTFV